MNTKTNVSMNCAITALALFAVLLPALGVTVPPPKGLPAGSKGPDISVRRVTVDPANPMTGQSFRVEVSISNDGDWPSSLGNCRIEIMNSNGLVVAMSEIVHADVGPKNMEQYGRSFSLKQPGEYIARATWYTELPDFKGLQDKSETSFTCSGTDISGVKQNPFDLDGSLARQEAERKLSEQQQAAEASRQVQLPQQPQQQLVQQAELARQERARQQQAEQAKQEQAKREQVRQQQLEQERQDQLRKQQEQAEHDRQERLAREKEAERLRQEKARQQEAERQRQLAAQTESERQDQLRMEQARKEQAERDRRYAEQAEQQRRLDAERAANAEKERREKEAMLERNRQEQERIRQEVAQRNAEIERRAAETQRARAAYIQQQQAIAAQQQYQDQSRRQKAQEAQATAAQQDAINRQQAAGQLLDMFGQMADNQREREAREQAEREVQAQAARQQAQLEQARVQVAQAEADRILAERGNNTVTFRIKSSHPNTVNVRFYSLDRDRAWPAADRAYILDDSQVHQIPIQGEPGERIAFGAWVAGSSSTSWGAGVSKPTSGNYYPCNGGTTAIINLK